MAIDDVRLTAVANAPSWWTRAGPSAGPPPDRTSPMTRKWSPTCSHRVTRAVSQAGTPYHLPDYLDGKATSAWNRTPTSIVRYNAVPGWADACTHSLRRYPRGS